MKNLKRSEKILLSILALAIVFYVYYTFLLNPVLENISASHNNIKGFNQQLNDIKLKEAQTVKLKTDYEALKSDYDKLVLRFPSFEKDPQIGYDLKILADKNQVAIESENYSDANSAETANNTAANSDTSGTSPKTSTEKKETRYKLNYVAVNINISGTYEGMKAFINSLENEERSTIIQNVNITKKDNSLTASIAANFYYITDTQNTENNSYPFNNKNYGKSNFFN